MLTTSRAGAATRTVTGEKSCSVSYGSFSYRLGLIVWLEPMSDFFTPTGIVLTA